MVTCQKNLGSVGSALNYYYFFLMSGKTGNKTLLLIKQHIAYMNISRYANIDKFVNIRYIYIFTSPSGIQLIISASPNVEITSPGHRARGFFNP
jgi:hypothetical protein